MPTGAQIGSRMPVQLLGSWVDTGLFPHMPGPSRPRMMLTRNPRSQTWEKESLLILLFYLLTPDYTPEQLDLTAVLPQSLHEILDLVRTCRAEDRRALLFPELVELTPQPDPGWGLLLALPAWPYEYACVGLDLSLFDGRIFAAVALPVMDTYALCEVAGLAPHAEVDIYLPGAYFPCAERRAVRTAHGTLYHFSSTRRTLPSSLSSPCDATVSSDLGAQSRIPARSV